ncbi:flavodoxin family protein, partial [Devosia sp.]|uniref:flavodoxin family protein n=1 Tax=Devosia sp. TaxID=1871048 RepID=UPI002F0C3702
MKIGIVYGSVFGNTAEIARAIKAALETAHEVLLLPVGQAGADIASRVDLLVVGSPTRGFRPTPDIAEFVAGLPAGNGARAAAFDTRMNPDDVHPAPLRWMMDAGGYAAERIATTLRERGYDVIAEPAGFLVGGAEG